MSHPALRFAAVLAVGLVVVPAMADPSGVVAVPSASILSGGQWRLKAEQDVNRSGGSNSRRTDLFTQLGIGTRIEAGLDLFGVGHEGKLAGNIKLQLRDPSTQGWGAAVGVAGMSEHQKPLYYGVASGSYHRARLHAGIGGDGHVHALVATEVALSENVGAFGEVVSGPGGPVTAGVQLRLSSRTGVQAYWQRVNSGGNRIQLRMWTTGLLGR
jgi:hypothetical protein